MHFLKVHHIVSGILAVMVLIGVAVAGYYYNQYQAAQNIIKNPNLAVQKQTAQIVAQVGLLMDLPKDETPTVATVTDASKLKDQPFFKNAKNGDKVLIYVKAKKAILYDPTANKIVDVAPVNIAQQPSVQVTPSAAVQQSTQAPVHLSPTFAPTAVVSPSPSK